MQHGEIKSYINIFLIVHKRQEIPPGMLKQKKTRDKRLSKWGLLRARDQSAENPTGFVIC